MSQPAGSLVSFGCPMMRILLLAIVVSLVGMARLSAADVDFNRDVRPILADACWACHGPDDKARKADLRLDRRAEAIVSAIVPGKPAESELLKRILSHDPQEVMPPPKTGKKLTPAQVETLRQWIASGAEYQGHWAFMKPVRSPVPALGSPAAKSNPIDAFVQARLAREGLTLSPQADKETLIRRVTLDLTGLPPTLAEVDAFLADTSPTAYETFVDRLLASPRYGERMALDWLDAARFADTHGYHIDSGRDMTRWREYVIRAFNQNMPFDRFTIEQFAGDLLPNPTLDQKIATGFHRNHMINYEGGAIPDEYLTAYIVDRVNTTATVWMGLTIGCAQCHDHKYDPLTMTDFYRMYAFFNTVPENGIDGQRGNAAPVLRVPTAADEKTLAKLRADLKDAETRLAGPHPEVAADQREWEKTAASRSTRWTAVIPQSPMAKNGSRLQLLADLSVKADGPNPATETYTVSFRPGLKRVTAVRVEALADDAFPARGPGRGVNGNFVMTGVRLSTDGTVDRIAIKRATANFSQKEGNYDVNTVLGQGPGWAISPQFGKNHWAIFELTEPQNVSAKSWLLQLQFQSGFASHQMGRFRISVTDSDTPHQVGGPPPDVLAILKIEPAQRTPAQTQTLRTHYETNVSPKLRAVRDQIASLKKQIADTESQAPTAMVMQDLPKPRDTFMLDRGQYDKKLTKVTAGTPASLPPLPKDAPVNRLSLARWLVSPEHPLTARVTVNRYWQAYFGTGLVKTAEDFGTQGEYPSHPELLDWLAVEFRESGWDVKQMQRRIVTSQTYQQQSRVTPELMARDPENRLLARMSRLRLPAEFLRDLALSTSGLLNGEIGGKSVSPYQPAGIWEELTFRLDNKNFTAQVYEQSHGKDLYRRTMYTFWKRTAPPPSLVTLDAPDREICTVRRSRTNTPLQALVLMNDPTYVEASRKLAERILTEGGTTTSDRITFAFRTVTARRPTDREMAILVRLFETQLAKYRTNPAAATKLLVVGESPRDVKLDPASVAAWAMVASAILNLDEAVNRN